MQLDRSWYKHGDTLWYKAYLLNRNLSASLQSGLIYIELINDSSRVVKRQMIKANGGVAAGDIEIKRKFIPGTYTLRAYTNWMRNFGIEKFFSCKINIAPSGNNYWLINEHHTFDKNRNVNMQLHFGDLTPKNIGFRDMQLNVLDGTDILLKKSAITDPYGNLNYKFKLPDKKLDHVSLQIEDMGRDADLHKFILPVSLNKTENTDLQFMPEGGSLLAGLPTKVGFKAVGEDGTGVTEIKGVVYNNAMQQVASFKSIHMGMGLFTFTPKAGETYTAKVVFKDTITKNYALPAVKTSGIILQVKNLSNKDTLELQLQATPDILADGKNYTLIGMARDSVCYTGSVFFKGMPVVKAIPKKLFATGVIKFILLDAANDPLTQRLVFIDQNDELNIKISSNKPVYNTRDSVSLQVYVTDTAGKPVKGNFSLAVTDNGEVKAPDVNAENIATRMLLTTDLKGTIEEPGYYFNKSHADRVEVLDNLLLTQGWVSYDFKKCLEPDGNIQYKAEDQLRITGKATNIFDGSIADTRIQLKSEIPVFQMETQTDKKGRFEFSDLPDMDNIDLMIQAVRSFNIGVKVDEFEPPEVKMGRSYSTPWFVNSDSSYVNYVTGIHKVSLAPGVNAVKLKPGEELEHGKRMLKEVVINRHKYRPPPPVRLALDEEDVKNARTGAKPLTLMELLNLKENINSMYKLLIVDEVPLVPFNSVTSSDARFTVDRWLEYYTTNDIIDFRVERMFLNTKQGELPALRIYVTTNAHNGGDMTAVGGYAYRPMPFSYPHKFYSPRYKVNDKDAPVTVDKRSTVYWSPEVITDDAGKANVSFYTSDQLGTYTLNIEGGNMSGNIGHQSQQIRIIPKQ
ncbi:MAG TPA: hypothetical protein VL490_02470 [Mucilaginibacter sp.]|nr:hypothetical protein [Mucilaginibacter sp.]